MTMLYNTGVTNVYVKRHSPKANIWIIVAEYEKTKKKPKTICQVFDEFHARELRIIFRRMYGLNPHATDSKDWFVHKSRLEFEQDSDFKRLNNIVQQQVNSRTWPKSEREELSDLVSQMLSTK